jgi:hypothetical protein
VQKSRSAIVGAGFKPALFFMGTLLLKLHNQFYPSYFIDNGALPQAPDALPAELLFSTAKRVTRKAALTIVLNGSSPKVRE